MQTVLVVWPFIFDKMDLDFQLRSRRSQTHGLQDAKSNNHEEVIEVVNELATGVSHPPTKSSTYMWNEMRKWWVCKFERIFYGILIDYWCVKFNQADWLQYVSNFRKCTNIGHRDWFTSLSSENEYIKSGYRWNIPALQVKESFDKCWS